MKAPKLSVVVMFEKSSTEALAFTVAGDLNVVLTNTLPDAKTSLGDGAYMDGGEKIICSYIHVYI